MMTRFMLVLIVLVSCSGAASGYYEPPERGEKCTLNGLSADFVSVSCGGEACMVCNKRRCRTYLLSECR